MGFTLHVHHKEKISLSRLILLIQYFKDNDDFQKKNIKRKQTKLVFIIIHVSVCYVPKNKFLTFNFNLKQLYTKLQGLKL